MQVIVEGLVALFERTALDVLDLEDGLVDRGSREALVDASEGILQDAREEYVAVLIGSALDVGAIQVRTKTLKLIPRRAASSLAASRRVSGIRRVTDTWSSCTK